MIIMQRIALSMLLLATVSVAHALANGATIGPHGGQIQHAETYHLELVAADGELTLYVTDVDGNPVDVDGASTTALVLANRKKTKLTLEPGGDNMMTGQGDFPAADGMKVLISLTIPGEKRLRARFSPKP